MLPGCGGNERKRVADIKQPRHWRRARNGVFVNGSSGPSWFWPWQVQSNSMARSTMIIIWPPSPETARRPSIQENTCPASAAPPARTDHAAPDRQLLPDAHITVAALVAYAVTGSLICLALTLSLLEPAVQAFAFFFHREKPGGAPGARPGACTRPAPPHHQGTPLMPAMVSGAPSMRSSRLEGFQVGLEGVGGRRLFHRFLLQRHTSQEFTLHAGARRPARAAAAGTTDWRRNAGVFMLAIVRQGRSCAACRPEVAMEEMLDMEGLAGWGWKVPIVDRSEAGCKTLHRSFSTPAGTANACAARGSWGETAQHWQTGGVEELRRQHGLHQPLALRSSAWWSGKSG